MPASGYIPTKASGYPEDSAGVCPANKQNGGVVSSISRRIATRSGSDILSKSRAVHCIFGMMSNLHLQIAN
jgi:hypothetical protein